MNVQILMDFSSETMQVRRKQNNISNILKETGKTKEREKTEQKQPSTQNSIPNENTDKIKGVLEMNLTIS